MSNTKAGQGDVELGQVGGQPGGYPPPAREDPMAILNECREVSRGIDTIGQNLQQLQYLQQRALDDPDASQNTQTNRELDSLSSETMTLYRSFAARITKLKQTPGAGDPKNAAQVGSVDRKLKEAIQRYQTVDADFRKKLQQQMARQYRIVRPDASEAEVREACEDTTSTQVFSQAVSQGSSEFKDQTDHHSCSSCKATAVANLNLPSVPSKADTKPFRRSRNRSSNWLSSSRI